MKVTRYDDRRLVIDKVPWVMGLVFITAILVLTLIALLALERRDFQVAAVVGLCALVFPGGAFAVLAREQLILDRDLGQVVVRRRNLLRGLEELREPLEDLRGTVIEWSDSPRRERMHRMALVLGPALPAGEEDIRKGGRLLPPFIDWGNEGHASQAGLIVEAWMTGKAAPVFGGKRGRES